MRILEELAAITLKPIKIIEFTNKYDPIPFLGIDVGHGIGGLIRDVSNVGLEVLDRASQLVTNVVDKGLNVLSEPVKIVIITVSVIGGIFYFLSPTNTLNLMRQIKQRITHYPPHPHIWKHHDKYYK